MWTLPPQDVTNVDAELTSALTYANGAPVYSLSEVERAAIHVVYQTYDALLGQPDPSLSPAALATCRQHVESSYSEVQLGGRLESLRSRLLASTDACPYCGFGEPTQLDHYLPQSVYGELAIYPNNLVPSCGPCNNAKRTIIPGVAPAQGPGLIHPYFQALPATVFLKADVTFDNASLDVTFYIDAAGIGHALAEKLRFQLTRLKLADRYPKQINKFLSEQRTGILMFKDQGADNLAQFFLRSTESMAASFGLNDWRLALLRGLAENRDFCTAPELYLGGPLVGSEALLGAD